MAAIWDENFVNGLEALLVECAVIHDDIERDCFVSRVYCWFTEKLLERREVPRYAPVELAALRDSLHSLGGDKPHTVKGLEGYSPDGKKDPRVHLQEIYDNEGGGVGLPHMHIQMHLNIYYTLTWLIMKIRRQFAGQVLQQDDG
ncbi:hypothetical protein EON65_52420, partial [archaeon]